MNRLIEIITSDDDQVRDQSLASVCCGASLDELLSHINAIDQFRRDESNLYRRVRALFFLAAIYRYHLPNKLSPSQTGLIPFDGYEHLLKRRFVEAIDIFYLDYDARHLIIVCQIKGCSGGNIGVGIKGGPSKRATDFLCHSDDRE